MKLTKEERIRIYETVMNKLAPVVSNRLYEMSNDLLDRAIIAAVDKGDFVRAKKFSDYKNSSERTGKPYIPELEHLNKEIITAVEMGDLKLAKQLSDYKKREYPNE